MAPAIAVRGADGLTEWEEEVGGQEAAQHGQIAFAVALEAPYEQLQSTPGCCYG